MTAGDALKAVIAATGRFGATGGRIFRDAAPDNMATWPYVTYIDGVADPSVNRGDGRTLTRRRVMIVDLWQKSRDEEDDLPRVLERALDGLALDGVDEARVYRVRVDDVARITDEPGVVHHSFSLSLARLV